MLEGLEHHRAKAADVARAIRICRGEILSDDCGECPYYEDCRDGTHKLDLDIESLLVEVCLQVVPLARARGLQLRHPTVLRRTP